MDWSALLRMPMTVLLVLAAVFALITLVQLVALRQRLHGGRHLAASWRALLCVGAFALTLLLAGAGCALRGYRLLGEEAPVVEIDAHILSPQRWVLTLSWPDGSTRRLQLAGDAWRVEAIVLKWKLPALLAGVPPLYRLDRLSGRYDDPVQEAQAPRTVIGFDEAGAFEWKLPALLAGVPPLYRLDRLSGRYDDPVQEAQAPRTVIGFDEAGAFDLLNLKKQYPRWVPEIDTVYGSGAFLPLVDGGHYAVSLMRTGALVARPDAATAEKISHPLGG